MRLESQVIDCLTRLGADEADHLLIAVSGGLDSMVLTHLLSNRWAKERLVACTVDHGLYPGSSDDAAWVASTMNRMGVRHVVRRVESARMNEGEGVEDGARRARYDALRTVGAENGARWILTAHHRQDNAETVLMRAVQGAGVYGLRGIPPRNGNILRPMLGIPKADIEAYANREKVSAKVDPTNSEERFVRNALRASVLPALANAVGPSVTVGLSRVSENMIDVEETLVHFLTPYLERTVFKASRETWVECAPFVTLPPSIRRVWLLMLWRELARDRRGPMPRPSRAHLSALAEMLSGAGPRRLSLNLGWEATREGRWLVFDEERPTPTQWAPTSLRRLGMHTLGDWSVEISEDLNGPGVVLSVGEGSLPWRARVHRIGDRFRPHGLSGTKAVSELWTDTKFPARWRSTAPIIEVNGQMALVAGIRPGEGFQTEPGGMGLRVHLQHKIIPPRSDG